MAIEIKNLNTVNLLACVALDYKWFGEHGISRDELAAILAKQPENCLGVFEQDKLLGFAVFEILNGEMPRGYAGGLKPDGRILFIQQFTTTTNYLVEDSSADEALLKAIEQKAIDFQCPEIWEALAVEHPYSKARNSEFDAFGFYLNHGFKLDKTINLTWQPSAKISIPCYLFRFKK